MLPSSHPLPISLKKIFMIRMMPTTESPENSESSENENAGITPTPESLENTDFPENGNDENVPGQEDTAI